jgi:large subunit GTPase 1
MATQYRKVIIFSSSFLLFLGLLFNLLIVCSLEEEEHVVFTPFERNLEVWRQLWRVTERSDVLVQIVDARNPLLFYFPDLVKYAHEVNPSIIHVLLVNKADFLSLRARVRWARYFQTHKIRFVFFSANFEALDTKHQHALQNDLGFDVEQRLLEE